MQGAASSNWPLATGNFPKSISAPRAPCEAGCCWKILSRRILPGTSASNLWGGESPDGHRRSCDASWHSWSPPWERGQRENRDVDVVLTFLLPKQDRYHSQESVKMIQDRPAG